MKKSNLTTLCYLEKDDSYLMMHRVRKKQDVNAGKWIGVGGHFELGESPEDCLLREVKEETGLDIQNPHLCGVYHWYKGEIHNVVFLYKADRYTGELRSSEEGNVYWVSKKEFKKKQLAPGMEEVLHIMDSEQISECYEQLEDGEYVGALY